MDIDRDLRSTSSPTESLKHLASFPYDDKKSYKVGGQEECKGTLDSVWNEATELCQPTALKIFLRKRGKLSSLCVNEGLAVAELEFHHRDYVSKAEKSWKLIANSLQLVLGCNIEIRINLVRCNSDSQYVKVRKLSFSLFSCCRRMQQKSFSSNEQGSDTDYCGHASQKPMMERPQSCSCDCGSRVQHDFYHRMDAARTLRNNDEDLLSSGKTLSCGSFQETSKTSGLRVDTPKEERKNYGCEVLSVQEPDRQPNCFPKNLWLHKKLRFANASMTSFMGTQQQKEFVLSIPSYT